MKKSISLLILFVLLFSLFSFSSQATSGTIGATFYSDQKTVTVGNTVEYKLSLDVSENTSIGGLGFKLKFDSSAFCIESATPKGSFSDADVSVNSDLGIVTFAWESLNAVQSATDVLTVVLTTYPDAYTATYTPAISGLEIYDDTVEMNDILAWTEDIGSITVTDTRVLTGIALKTLPTKINYTVNSDLDTTGLSITLYYSDNTTEVMSEGYVTLYDFSSAGTKNVVVYYNGFQTASFTVTVTVPPVLTGISINTKPNTLTYVVGAALDTTGLTLLLTYSDNSTKIINKDYTAAYDFSTVGTKNVVISYGGFQATPFTVTVTSGVVLPTAITSSTFSVSVAYLSKIAKGTTVATLKNGLNEKDYITVFMGSAAANASDTVKTGMTVSLITNGTVKKTLTVVVTGDINGDGDISISDMIAVKSELLGKSALSGAAEKAADTNGDKSVSITDFIQIKAFLLGKEAITPRTAD